MDFTLAKYFTDRDIIRRQYEELHKQKNEILDMWETLFNNGILSVENKEDFSTLIDLVINDIEEKNRFKSIESNAVLRDDYEINDFELSNNEHSTWGAFKIHMAKKNIDTKWYI